MSEDDEPPVMLIVAGPNGAGKSTLSSILVQRFPLLDPDAIAREEGLSPIAAGRVILSRIQSHIDKAESFIVETTLSGKTFFNALQQARDKGFQLELHFVGVEAPDVALERVRQRVPWADMMCRKGICGGVSSAVSRTCPGPSGPVTFPTSMTTQGTGMKCWPSLLASRWRLRT